jgi:hypothetical protein
LPHALPRPDALAVPSVKTAGEDEARTSERPAVGEVAEERSYARKLVTA